MSTHALRAVCIALLLLFSLGCPLVPQQGVTVLARPNLTETAMAVEPTADGGVVITGLAETWITRYVQQQELYLVKRGPRGEAQWTRTFLSVDPVAENPVAAVETIAGNAVRQLADGYAVAGVRLKLPFTVIIKAGSQDLGERAFLLRTDLQGHELWRRTYGDHLGMCWANDFVETSDGGFAMAVTAQPADIHEQAYLLRVGPGGDEVWWTDGFGGALDDAAQAVRALPDGAFAVAGYATRENTKRVPFLLRVDAQGEVEWLRQYDLEGQWAFTSLLPAPEGGFFLAGISQEAPSGQFYLVHADPDGHFLEGDVYASGSVPLLSGVTVTADGGCLLAGTAPQSGTDSHRSWVGKVDADGAEQWAQSIGATALATVPMDVEPLPAGGFVAVDNAFRLLWNDPSIVPLYTSDVRLAHFAADGELAPW